MSFFKRLRSALNPGSKPAPDPVADEEMIRVFDSYGRELRITQDEWRNTVLPDAIKQNWERPDELYHLIVTSLQDGFRSEIIPAAQHLYDIDTDRIRSTNIWGIVLLQEGRLDEAGKALRSYLSEHGDDGTILTNLAKVHSARGNDAEADRTLWHALEVDPNLDNGLLWYLAQQRERHGESGEHEALRRVAALPRSWRARLWMARAALQRDDANAAMQLYRDALAASANPVPADLLMQMSGDLGNAGHIEEIIDLTLPRFDVQQHGLPVGNNLIRAFAELGRIEDARRILQQMYAENRPDWKATLHNLDMELAQRALGTAPLDAQEKLRVEILMIATPAWLHEDSPAQALFGHMPRGSQMCFLGSTAQKPDAGTVPVPQLSDAVGRLSRALPLFLGEHVYFATDASTYALIPWIAMHGGGFMVRGTPWEDEEATGIVQSLETTPAYVVVTHVNAVAEPWTITARVLRTIDTKPVATAEASFPPEGDPREAVSTLAGKISEALAQHTDLRRATPPEHYRLPSDLTDYLLRLEQLLAVRCSGIEGVPKAFLSGAREIVDGNIRLCLDNPASTTARILLLATCRAMRHSHSEVVTEFSDRIARLTREHPLASGAQAVVEELQKEVLTPA